MNAMQQTLSHHRSKAEFTEFSTRADSTSLGGQDRPQGTWKDSWHAFEQAVKLGKLRAIGADT